MRRPIAIGIVVLLALLFVGILIPMIANMRAESDRLRCMDHLRRIEFAGLHSAPPGHEVPLHVAHSFPAGTVMNSALEPEQRMSWYVVSMRALEQGPPAPEVPGKKPVVRPTPVADALSTIDTMQPWNGTANIEVGRKRVPALLCPSGVPNWPEGSAALTQYVGLAGLGLDVASLSPADAGKRAGVFNYNLPTMLSSFTDGLSPTLAYAETNDALGPWIRGGPSTVRGYDPERLPAIGVGAPFAGLHPGGGYFGFADGSVRFLSTSMNPAIFRAQLTRAGNEVFEFDSP